MPRQPDPDLEDTILNAAQKLWKKGGDEALTLRAVARAAGTNTPAVYRRFRDRNDIIRGLLRRVRVELAELMDSAASPEEGCERYLDYALSHPHEYALFYQYHYEIDHSPRSRRAGVKVERPARDAMRRKLEEKFAGRTENHEKMVIALWMLGHGAAMLLIAKSIPPNGVKEARAVFRASVKALLC